MSSLSLAPPTGIKKECAIEADKSESIDECPVNISQFDLIKKLGDGSFGTVFLVKKNCGIDNGELYALKVINKAKICNSSLKVVWMRHMRAERTALEKFRHCPYIQKLYYAFQTGDKLFLVTEYAAGGETFTLIRRSGLPERQVRFYMAELIVALEYIHKHEIAFRDIKLENVLIDADGHVKLVDFGLCKKIGQRGRTKTYCGSVEYMSPEVIACTGHNTAVDWWGLGVLAIELLTSRSPFGSSEGGTDEVIAAIQTRILNEDPIIPNNISDEMEDFLTKILTKDPAKRLGGSELAATAIKQHRLFDDIDWEKVENKKMPPPYIPTITHQLDIQNFSEEFTQQPAFLEPSEIPANSFLLFKGYSFIAPELRPTQSDQNGHNADREPDSRIVSKQPLVKAHASKVQNKSEAKTPKNEPIEPIEDVIMTADDNNSKFKESRSKNTEINGNVAKVASKKRNRRKSISVEPTMPNSCKPLDPVESVSLLKPEEIKVEQRVLRKRKSVDSAQTMCANKRTRKLPSVHKKESETIEIENEEVPLPRKAKTKRTEKPNSKISKTTTTSSDAQPGASEPVKPKPIKKTTPKLPGEHIAVPTKTLERQPKEILNLTEEQTTSPVKTDQATQTDHVPKWPFNKPIRFQFYCFEQYNYK